MASIEKLKNGSYRIVVSDGYDSAGKKIRHKETISLNDLEGLTERQKEKEIQKRAVLFEERVKNGLYMDGEKITFAEFANRWFEDYAKKQLSLGTQRSYKMRLDNRIIPIIGHIKLAKLQPHHLLEFYNRLGEEGVRQDFYYKPTNSAIASLKAMKTVDTGVSAKTHIRLKNGEKTNYEAAKRICDTTGMDFKKSFTVVEKAEKLSDKMIKSYHDLISSILSVAVEWNIINNNVAERVRPPKVESKPPKYLDDEQIAQLFIALEDAPIKYKTAIYLTIDTGLRLSEVAGLEWADVNFEENTICINKQRQYISGEGICPGTPKTISGNRYISVSNTVMLQLKAFRKEQAKNRLQVGSLWVESDNVFIHEDGRPMHPHRPYKWFVEFLEKNNLPHMTYHSLRHTNASLLIASGIDVVTLSSRLGHAEKSVTLNKYSHIIKSKEKQAANMMEQFYSGNISEAE